MSPKNQFMANNIDKDKVAQLLRDCAKKCILPRYNKLKSEDVSNKTSPVDIVTIADKEAEKKIIKDLTTLYPGSIVIGEEGIYEGKASLDELKKTDKIVWVVDPIDGTNNFVAGKRNFGIMLACVINGKTQYGWIYDILGDEIAIAEKGKGAYFKGQKLKVNQTAEIDESKAFIGIKYLPSALQNEVKSKRSLLKKSSSLNCVAHEYLRLAQGHSDIGIYGRIKPWDHLAGVLLVQEAGGTCLKWDKTEYTPQDHYGGILIASNKSLWNKCHDLFLKDFVLKAKNNPKLLK